MMHIELFREQKPLKVNVMKITTDDKRKNLFRCQFDWCENQNLKHESLILAQDERWRRA